MGRGGVVKVGSLTWDGKRNFCFEGKGGFEGRGSVLFRNCEKFYWWAGGEGGGYFWEKGIRVLENGGEVSTLEPISKPNSSASIKISIFNIFACLGREMRDGGGGIKGKGGGNKGEFQFEF